MHNNFQPTDKAKNITFSLRNKCEKVKEPVLQKRLIHKSEECKILGNDTTESKVNELAVVA